MSYNPLKECSFQLPCNQCFPLMYLNYLDSLNYKEQYIQYSSFQVEFNDENFSTYLKDFVMFSLPVILFLFLGLHTFFRLLFNYPISKFIRKYYFLGILLLLIFEGNIEEITFYIFAELKSFFTLTFKHKIFNVFILFAFFVVVLMCFDFYLLSKYHYRKKAKFVIET